VSQTKREHWQKLIAEQAASSHHIQAFCRERNVSEHSFHWWRRQLREDHPVRFALLEAGSTGAADVVTPLELLLRSGERLRIGKGVDAATLRAVLDALRA
jgi:hypothetical protein